MARRSLTSRHWVNPPHGGSETGQRDCRIMEGVRSSSNGQANISGWLLQSTIAAIAAVCLMGSALSHPMDMTVSHDSAFLTRPQTSPPSLGRCWVSESGTYLLTANTERSFDGRLRYMVEQYRDDQWSTMLECELSCVIRDSVIDDDGHVLALAVDSSAYDAVDQCPSVGRFTVITFTRAGLCRTLASITSTTPFPHALTGLPRVDGLWKLDNSTVALRCSGGDGPDAHGLEYAFRVQDGEWTLDAGPRSVSAGAMRIDGTRVVACMVPGTLLQLVAWERILTGPAIQAQDALYIRVYSPNGLSVLDSRLILERTAGPDTTAPDAVGLELHSVVVRPRKSQSSVCVVMEARDIGQGSSWTGTVRVLPTSESVLLNHDTVHPTRLMLRGRARLGDDKSPRPVPDVIGVSPNGSVTIIDLVHGLWSEYDRAGARECGLAFSPNILREIIPGQCVARSHSGTLVVGAAATGGNGIYLMELTRADNRVASRRVTRSFAGRTVSCVEYPHVGYLGVIDDRISLSVAASGVYAEGPIVDLDGVRIHSIYGVAFAPDGAGAAVASVLLRDGREVPCFIAYDQRGQVTHLQVDSLRARPVRTAGIVMRNGKVLVWGAHTSLVVWDPSGGTIESLECAAMCEGSQPQVMQYARDADEILLIDERTLDITHIGIE